MTASSSKRTGVSALRGRSLSIVSSRLDSGRPEASCDQRRERSTEGVWFPKTIGKPSAVAKLLRKQRLSEESVADSRLCLFFIISS